MTQPVIPFLIHIVGPVFCLPFFAFLDSPNITKYNMFKFWTNWFKSQFFKEFSENLMSSRSLEISWHAFNRAWGFLSILLLSRLERPTSYCGRHTDGRWGCLALHSWRGLSNNAGACFLGHWITCVSISDDPSEILR